MLQVNGPFLGWVYNESYFGMILFQIAQFLSQYIIIPFFDIHFKYETFWYFLLYEIVLSI